MIKIAIIADKTRLPIFMRHLPDETDISIIYATDNVNVNENNLANAQVMVVDIEFNLAKSFIQKSSKAKKIPIVAVADQAANGFRLLENGATEMQLHSAGQSPRYFCRMLANKIRSASKRDQVNKARNLKNPRFSKTLRGDKVIVMGASTGGTTILEFILKSMPTYAPPILIVQHMPPIFTRMFAERLDSICHISVWEAIDGDSLTQGLALVAPGNFHMGLAKNADNLHVKIIDSPHVCNQKPSVDVLFESVADVLNNDSKSVLGIILTGMGNDGAKGLLKLRRRGAQTIGQDKSSCTVYGMPKAAFECGAVGKQLHLNDIVPEILKFIQK
ncbi:MAG: CheB methylesterase domain-containing protein [Turicibacter sp.]|nr:CheB methylesterase domain-containing protein [Turicibacter sp.]